MLINIIYLINMILKIREYKKFLEEVYIDYD